MFAINPLSVLGLSSIVQEQKASQVVLSAASSNVSKMVVRLLARKWPSILIYGLSRSDNLDAELKALGYHSLFRMEEAPKLKEALRQDQNAVFLDCVGGNFAGNIFNVLPIGSTMVNYGRLSKENLGNIDLA